MPKNTARAAAKTSNQPWYAILYVQVLIAIAIGIAVGYFLSLIHI